MTVTLISEWLLPYKTGVMNVDWDVSLQNEIGFVWIMEGSIRIQQISIN